jgi:DNA-binding winged helix-turn-helix (wHTH) protein/predicted esterase
MPQTNDESAPPSGPFRLGEWLVEPSLNRLTRDSGSVQLEPRVMDLLVFLARRPGEVLSQQAIIDGVWAAEFVGEGVLRRAITVLREALGDDAKNPAYIDTISKRGYRLIAAIGAVDAAGPALEAEARAVAQPPLGGRLLLRALTRPRVLIPSLVVLALVGVVLGRSLHLQSKARWAHQTAIPEINRLIDRDDFWGACAVAEQAERYISSDPTLAGLWGRISNTVGIRTEPPGVTVSFKPYDRVDDEWTVLGQTPLEEIRVPLGVFRLRHEKAGYETREVARRTPDPRLQERSRRARGPVDESRERPPDFTLDPEGTVPEGMVAVDGGVYREAPFVGIASVSIPRFCIDRTEVTNRAFQEFVDAGGYETPELWKEEFVRDGRVVPFEEAMRSFRDSTGRPGPADWTVGHYPDGRADHPVAGVSWYEAAAYCGFRGKSLPTVYHWQRAALPGREAMLPMSPSIIALSNFGGQGPAPVASYPGIGASGAYDLAGNVREWCSNAVGENRFSLGGAWSDPPYGFSVGFHPPPWDRAPQNGFRCVSYIDGEPGEKLTASRPTGETPDFYSVPRGPDEAFETLRRTAYSYDRTPLNAVVESTGPSPLAGQEEWVSLDAAYGDERLLIRLHLPDRAEPPYQAVVWWGGVQQFTLTSITHDDPVNGEALASLVKSGRAVVQPIYAGSFERNDGRTQLRRQRPNTERELHFQCFKDVGRTLDYLAERPDIDGGRVAYAGASLGASVAPYVLAFEDRFRAALLWSGGIGSTDEVDLTRRVTTPTLMVNGRYDYLVAEPNQRALFDLLGTPAEDKRRVVFDAGHWPFPRGDFIRENLAWLDKYLGPVETR